MFRMKKMPVMLALSLAVGYSAMGQISTGPCGTTAEDQWLYTARLQENVAKAGDGTAVSDRSAIQYVPIFFHLTGDANGNGKHKVSDVLNQICDLNDAYAPMEMRFYLKPHPTYGLFDYSINNQDIYTAQSTQSSIFQMNLKRHNSALNVFTVGTCKGDPSVLAYYSTPDDWIVSRNNQINGNGNGTLAHEIGHYFSLRHTFYGWELDGQDVNEPRCFDPADPGWPIAPLIAPYHPDGANIPTEYQNGSNGTTAADMIADTPPDYNFGYCATTCSPYTGIAKDPSAVQVDPMENNFMGYFIGCSTYVFTPIQQSVVLADLASPARNYLDNNFTPLATNIDTPTDLLTSPADNITVPYYDEVSLEWQSVAGANNYLLEIDISTFFNTVNYQSFVIQGTSKLITNLQSNRTYYWRVRPFNEYVTCAAARQLKFKTSLVSAVAEIPEIGSIKVAPNPVNAGEQPSLLLQVSTGFEANIRIVDAVGRVVWSQAGQTFPAGEMVYDLPVAGLSEGLYFITLESGSGRTVRKMMVSR
jgi:hypothetical protein